MGREEGRIIESRKGTNSEGPFLKAKQSTICQNYQMPKPIGIGIKDSRMQWNKFVQTSVYKYPRVVRV